jgi:hypothetical protein
MVTTTNGGCTRLQGSGVAAPKQLYCSGVNVVNNCDGTSTLTVARLLLWALVNQLLQ